MSQRSKHLYLQLVLSPLLLSPMPFLPLPLSLLLLDHKLGLGEIIIFTSLKMTCLYLAHESEGNDRSFAFAFAPELHLLEGWLDLRLPPTSDWQERKSNSKNLPLPGSREWERAWKRSLQRPTSTWLYFAFLQPMNDRPEELPSSKPVLTSLKMTPATRGSSFLKSNRKIHEFLFSR